MKDIIKTLQKQTELQNQILLKQDNHTILVKEITDLCVWLASHVRTLEARIEVLEGES